MHANMAIQIAVLIARTIHQGTKTMAELDQRAQVHEILLYGPVAKQEEVKVIPMMIFDGGFFSTHEKFGFMTTDPHEGVFKTLPTLLNFLPAEFREVDTVIDAPVSLHIFPMEVLTNPLEMQRAARRQPIPRFFAKHFEDPPERGTANLMRFAPYGNPPTFCPVRSAYFQANYRIPPAAKSMYATS